MGRSLPPLTKWLSEVTKYRVDGIPRFIFLDANNQAIGDTTGAIPRAVMAANIDLLIRWKKR